MDTLKTHDLQDEDDRISITSIESADQMLRSLEERPSSSMSSKSSRIPQLQKSSRTQRRSLGAVFKSSSDSKQQYLCRSASFSSSRGLAGLGSNMGYGQPIPVVKPKVYYTPELSRKIASYVSPYSRKLIMADKTHKSQTCQNKITRTDDDEKDSIKSFGSNTSLASCDGHSAIYTGGSRPKNVLHCSHTKTEDPDTYLTPTQRAMKKIKELQGKLKQAHKEIADKDCKIASLTRELVDYRFLKTEVEAGFHNTTIPEQISTEVIRPKSASPRLGSPSLSPPSVNSEMELDGITASNELSSTKDNVLRPSSGDSDSADFSRSLADSGHYDDLPSPCLSSKDGYAGLHSHQNRRSISHLTPDENSMVWAIGEAEDRIKDEYEGKIEELKRNQMNEYHEMKEKHNDHVEVLLNKLSEANLRYFELRPEMDKLKETLKEVEEERDNLREELLESTTKHQKIYLQMYVKGQQAAKLEAEQKNAPSQTSHVIDCDLESAESLVDDISIDLAKKLAEAENEILKLKMYRSDLRNSSRSKGNLDKPDDIDPEITLQFLKSAIYYFLTDKDNSQGHLRAIESILGYSSTEKNDISKGTRI